MNRTMTAEEAISYIDNYSWSSMKLGLGRTRTLLKKLGDPQNMLRFIHVAGSNGKGSTCAMLESIFRAAGYTTGFYPSPYIEDFCERIQYCGTMISREDLTEITTLVAEAADSMEEHPTQFELITAIGMVYFARRRCDIVILEVGLGGLYDSTNVIDAPECAVITNLGLEHTEYLGNTLGEIAYNKAGIIKHGCDVILYDNAPEAENVVRGKCMAEGCALYRADFSGLHPGSVSLSGQTFSFEGLDYELHLLGDHQLKNAAVALRTALVCRSRGWKLPDAVLQKGMQTVRWPARFEVLSEDPVFILDGGHNPQCAGALAAALDRYLPGQRVSFLLGILADKDYPAVIRTILPYAASFVCLTPASPRALSAEELCRYLTELGAAAETAPDPETGIRLCLAKGRPAVAFGSLYMAGGVRSAFRTMRTGGTGNENRTS